MQRISLIGELETVNRLKPFVIRVYNKLLKNFHKTPNILSNEETIKQLIEEKKSLARFGDGEMTLLVMSNDLAFQSMDIKLSKRLDEVLRKREKGFLVGLPRVFSEIDLKERNETSASFWEDHLLQTRHLWYQRIDFDSMYASSTFTRNYLTLKDKSAAKVYFDLVMKIWADRKVLVIEGAQSRVGVGNDLFTNAVEVRRILCPSTNAFSVYEKILESALEVSRDYLVLIALGPTATILAYDLFKNGFQAIDIGHIDVEFEWYLRKSEVREHIPGKYVAEAGGMNEDILAEDKEYKDQILKIII